MSHSTLIVAPVVDAERVAAMTNLENEKYPHFHCGNLDAGIFGQVFWQALGGEHRVDASSRIEIVHSCSTDAGSVIVHAIPRLLSERYARLTNAEIDELASSWSEADGYIRIPRSSEFNGRVMREIACLARLALERNQAILVRTCFRRS